MDESNMDKSNTLNLYDIPLLALRGPTRYMVISKLEQTKVLPSADKLQRDWRGLAHLAEVQTSTVRSARAVINAWEVKQTATLGHLEQFLGQLDRWDLVDDLYHLIREDAKVYAERAAHSSDKCITSPTDDEQILTIGDADRLERGWPLEVFDALLLYADQDLHFALQIRDRLEHANCKICMKDNLVGGLQFEFSAIMKLIGKRCHRVIVIVSQHFIDSPANRFFVLYAQATSIVDQRRILIPCIYGEGFKYMPEEIKYIYKLDFNKLKLPNYDFWGQLEGSVKNTHYRALPAPTCPSVTIEDMSTKTQQVVATSCTHQRTSKQSVATSCTLQSSRVPNIATSCTPHSINVQSEATSCTLHSQSLPGVDHKFSSTQLRVSGQDNKDWHKATTKKTLTSFFKSICNKKKQPNQNESCAIAM